MDDLHRRADEELLAAPADHVRLVGLRMALRALPLAMLGQTWSLEQRYGLLRLLQTLQFSWVSQAYTQLQAAGWTDDRIEHLELLWHQGRTASEIARFLGNVSRNAVIGKAHRMGLQSRPSAGRRELLRSEGPFFEGQAQNSAAIAIMRAASPFPIATGEMDATPNHLIANSLEELVEATEAVRVLYPALTPDRNLIPILMDFNHLRQGMDPIDVAHSRLWPTSLSLPLKTTFPTGRGWPFWRKWYDARRLGRTLERRPLPVSAEIEWAIAVLPEELWSEGPDAINYEISRILRKYPLDEMYEELEFLLEEPSIPDPSKLGSVDPQSGSAAIFTARSGEDIIDVDTAALTARIDDTPDARDRHKEVLDSVDDILSLYERFSIGGNQVIPLIQQAQRLKEALGGAPSEIRPGLLIPRGERLRQKLAAQEAHDEIGAEPPLPHQFLSNLKILVASYNVFVALDPVLAKYDEARLPPDLANKLIPPAKGSQLIHDAVARSIATTQVEDTLREESYTAPALPDPARRESRRFSESIRNFVRVALEKAFVPLKIVWKNRSVAQGIGQAIGKFARWITAHGEALLSLFPEGSATFNIIKFVVETTRKFS